MAAGTLYTIPNDFRSAKALIAAQYSGAKIEVTSFVLGQTNKSKAFLKKFPNGKVPAFETKDGLRLHKGNSIAFYVSNEELRGKTREHNAEILQWTEFAEEEILPASCARIFPLLAVIKHVVNTPEITQSLQTAKKDLKAGLTFLNNHLLRKTYLVGERITLADIVVFCNLLNTYKYIMDAEYKKQFVNVNRWFETLANQVEFKAVLGEIE